MPHTIISSVLHDIARADGIEFRRQEALLKTGALQTAILTSANFSIIATDEKGIIQLFNVGAERMLGYMAAEVVNKINPSDIHDPHEVMARAQALSLELATNITPGFEALAFKASRGIEDIYELTYMRECETMIESQADTRGISVSFPVFEQPCFVKADRTRLKQVLINLLSNAIKYNTERGTVKLKCVSPTPERIRICVEDTGKGLSPDKIEQLFQPFNRLGREANTEQGTGIGLVMTKRLVELMGGVIGVESVIGQGSVFWIEMIVTSEHKLYDAELDMVTAFSPPVPTDPCARTVLYVEDNPANLMLVEDLIARRADLRLLTARDGISGIAIARASMPDFILMAINLPGISGITAMKILQDDPLTAHIPVIALSANATPHDIERGLEAGFFRYLTKPIKINEFMETLDVALKASAKKAGLLPKEKHTA